MEEHPSFLVYKHLREFAEVRNCDCVEKVDLVRNEFLTTLKKVGYYLFQINHRADTKQATIIAILPPDSDYAKKGKELGNMIKIMEKTVPRGTNVREVIVIAPESVYVKKNILKKVRSFEIAASRGDAIKDEYVPTAKYYTICPYKNFYLNVLKHHSMGKYTVLKPGERDKVLKYQRKQLSNFPIIYSDNAPIVWIDARPGDFLMLERRSAASGKEVKYEVVVRRPL